MNFDPVLFSPKLTGPFCQKGCCEEGSIACGIPIPKDWTPLEIMREDYPLLNRREKSSFMKIKLINFGLEKNHYPFRPHENDAGADVYMPYDCTLKPGEIARIPLGFGLILPDGYAGYDFSKKQYGHKRISL